MKYTPEQLSAFAARWIERGEAFTVRRDTVYELTLLVEIDTGEEILPQELLVQSATWTTRHQSQERSEKGLATTQLHQVVTHWTYVEPFVLQNEGLL